MKAVYKGGRFNDRSFGMMPVESIVNKPLGLLSVTMKYDCTIATNYDCVFVKISGTTMVTHDVNR